MRNNKIRVWFPLIFALVMISGILLGYRLKYNTPTSSGFFSKNNTGTLSEVMELISKRYVDQVKQDSLSDEVIGDMLNHLDPHSVFIPAKDLQAVNEDLAGKFEGIGIEFNIFSDTINVLSVLKGGPSEKAGLQVGDKFLKVGDSLVAGNGISGDKVRKLLRGEGGSKVPVNVLRGKQQLQYTITRGTIPLYSRDAAYMISPGVGYIRLNKFAETTYEEFMEGMEVLKEKGLQKLVLDLRDNGGGILQEAVEIADEFLDGNKLIVYTVGSHTPKQEYHAKREGIFEKGKLVVLVDEGTASASEVLTGALQDWDRAEVIGRRTFGKGLVQEQYNLTDGAALRLTVARYYTPLGRSIQKPYDKGVENYNEEVIERYHNGALLNADSNKKVIGQPYHTPSGKLVYGGGGITPDVFVPLDTTSVDTSLTRLYRKNTIGNFVYRYYVDHLKYFQQFNTPVEFIKGFDVSEPIYNSMVDFAAGDSINLKSLSAKDKQFLMERLKSLFARQIWRSEGFYEVNNSDDLTVKKGLEELNK